MEFIKNNQCLKIRLKYDYESGQIAFQDFVEANGLEHISGCEWLKIGNQSAPHYKPEYLRDEDWDDISAELEPYCYMARGHSQGDYARLYLIGMEDAEAEALASAFESYAYDTPCYFDIYLIDCETGKVMDSTGLGGIYDTTSGLDYLKAELVSGIKSLSYLDDELKTLALEAVQDIDYTNIDNNF